MNSTLLDHLKHKYKIKTDMQLAIKFNSTPSKICKIRKGQAIGATLLLEIHKQTGMPFAKLRGMIAE